jgi:Flp pilus assembly pilin Flp
MPPVRRIADTLLKLRVWTDTVRTNTTAQDLIEYALMAGFVSVTTGALMPGAAANISRIFSSVTSVLFNSKNQGS